MKGDYLGSFEELVLLAVEALGDDAYAAHLQRILEREARRPISLGAVHTSLERLEAKTLLTSAESDPMPERGGSRRRVFTLTREGKLALREMRGLRKRVERLMRT